MPNYLKINIDSVLSHKYFKLFLLLSILLWLILKSPITFMPLLKELGTSRLNSTEVYFFYLNFFSWLIISIPIFYYIFSKSNFKTFIDKNRLSILLITNFFYTLFRTFKTFDVTDTGFHFTKAWGLFNNSAPQNIDFLVGTSFINGLWLNIFDAPNVLWARLGYVLVVTGIAVVSYKIFSLYFNRLTDWLLFFTLSLFFIHFNYYLSVNYDNLPVLFTLIGIWFLLKKDKTWIAYITSGIFLSFTIWLKFNFILIIALPAIYGWVVYSEKDWEKKEDVKKEKWLNATLLIYTGYIITLLTGILILFSTNYLSTYIEYIDKSLINRNSTQTEYDKRLNTLLKEWVPSDYSEEFVESKADKDELFFLTESQKSTSTRQEVAYSYDRDSHTLRGLFNNYFANFWWILKKGVIFSALLGIFLFLLGNKKGIKVYLFLLIASFAMYYIIRIRIEGSDFIFLSVLIFPAYIYLIYSLKFNDNLIKPTILILLLALFSFPGSNLSFNVIYRSGAGLLFLSFPLSFIINKKIYLGKQALNLNNYVIVFIIFIIFGIAKPWEYNNSHRDLDDRSVLVKMFESPQLFGIHTFPQRAMVIDEALKYFKSEKYQRNNTPALFLSWIPMMYYLTETNCITNNPWHGCVGFKLFKEEYDKNSKIHQPKYITFSKVVTRNPGWPLMDEEYREKDKVWIPDLKKFDYIKYWMKDKNYKKTFENKMFEVYKKQ